MRATVLSGPFDIHLDAVPEPDLREDTDAIVRVVAACVCGSDLWRYRGLSPVDGPTRMGHEFIGVVERTGSRVSTVTPGDFVVAPFTFSDGTCALCRLGVHTSCVNGGGWGGRDRQGHLADGAQGELIRVPWADGTLMPTPGEPPEELYPHLLALSDVFCTGHHAAVSAGVTAGSTVAVVGDGAVGLSAILAAGRMHADRIIAMSRHPDRQQLAREFGATDVVAERGKDGAARVHEIAGGIGADYVLECVGTGDAMDQAMRSARPGGRIGFVGLPHDVTLRPNVMFGLNIGVAGGVAPVRHYLSEFIDRVWEGSLRPGAVFDQTFPLDEVDAAYRAMHERRSVKAFLRV